MDSAPDSTPDSRCERNARRRLTHWMPPPVAFGVAWLGMWMAARVGVARYAFRGQVPLGIALVIIGLLLVIASLRVFAAKRTTPNPTHPEKATELVTTGPYALSRNPMYVGDALMLLGIAVWLGSVLALAFLVAFVVYIDRVQIAAEEVALTERFSDRYAEYRQRVRRWL